MRTDGGAPVIATLALYPALALQLAVAAARTALTAIRPPEGDRNA